MAPRKKLSSSSPIPIGNCEVRIEANNFTCKSDPSRLEFSLSRSSKITVSVVEEKHVENIHPGNSNTGAEGVSPTREYSFLLLNPKDADSCSKSYLQEVLQIYNRELPTMSYAANTGKQSTFMERCVLNGKYCTLVLRSTVVDSGRVLGAVTYQIIPSDTQYAEIPLAAVCSTQQHKGYGKALYMELRRRLQGVGIRTMFCWGDKESEGFWFKQGFVPIAEVDTRGKARRIPIKADIRRALCFPGGSTLMVSHIGNDIAASSADALQLCFSLNPQEKSSSNALAESEQLDILKEHKSLNKINRKTSGKENIQPEELVNHCLSRDNVMALTDGKDSRDPEHGCGITWHKSRPNAKLFKIGAQADERPCSCSKSSTKRVWESSLSSLKSKKVKGSHLIDCQPDCSRSFVPESNKGVSCSQLCSSGAKTQFLEGSAPRDPSSRSGKENVSKEFSPLNVVLNAPEELQRKKTCFKIMLMNIADVTKITHLTKVIQDLGGSVTSDGGTSTHVVTGKVRKTLNFCTALCTGAWIVSPSWLKESFREGRFVDESLYILDDGDYSLKYRANLKDAVLRARANPGALLKGYHVCISAHVQPPAKTLSTIVTSAGGNITCGLEKVKEATRTIFVACEEDMEEALLAVKKGIWTFSSEWLMNCVMRQELELEAPQFAESL